METLLLITFWISLLAIVVFIITMVVQFVKKDKVKGKRQLKWTGISIAIMVFSFIGLGFIEGARQTEKVEEKITTEQQVNAETKTKEAEVAKEDHTDMKPKTEKGMSFLKEEVALHDVTYIVNDVKTSNTVAGYTSQSGTYLIVTLTVRNDSDEAISLNNGDFTVFIDGAEYEDDPTTSAYHDGGFLLESLNPKMSKTASVVYEVPSNASETLKTLQIKPNQFKKNKLVVQLEERPK